MSQLKKSQTTAENRNKVAAIKPGRKLAHTQSEERDGRREMERDRCRAEGEGLPVALGQNPKPKQNQSSGAQCHYYHLTFTQILLYASNEMEQQQQPALQ